jgi:predicted  nucleic acid-binding Zn-ribbon protein
MADDVRSQNLFKQALDFSKSADDAEKKIDGEVKILSAKVPPALKDADHKMLEYYAKALRAELTAISASLQDVRSGLGILKNVEDDEEYLANHQKEVKDTTESLDTLRTTLTHQYESIENLEKQVKDNLKSVKSTKEDFFDEVAKFDNWISGTLKILKETQDKAETISMDIASTADDRDAKGLAAALKAMKDLDTVYLAEAFDRHEKGLKELLKKVDDRGFDAKVTGELKDSIGDLQERIDKARKDVKQLEDDKKEALDTRIEPVNVKEALKVLELDPEVEPKLAKILKGPPNDFEKGLTALAKELKLKVTGKQMLADLQKEGVV